MDLKSFEDSSRLWVLNHSKPFTSAMGKVHAPYSKKKIFYKDYAAARDALVPGAVLTTRTRGEATNLFIPGRYKHGAVFVGDDHIVEAIGAGVTKTHVLDFLLHKDAFAVYHPLFATPAQMQAAADFAVAQIGKPYDYDFKSGNDAFYCFELTYACYNEAMQNSPWQLRTTWGEPTVIGDDFIKATKKWQTAFEAWNI